MPNGEYQSFRELRLKGFDLVRDSVHAILAAPEYQPIFMAHKSIADVVVADGQNPRGKPVKVRLTTRDDGRTVVVAGNLVWQGARIRFRHVILWEPYRDVLLLAYDPGKEMEMQGGRSVIVWPEEGLVIT